MNRNLLTIPELVFDAFAKGDEAAWDSALPPAWIALEDDRQCDQWRAMRVRNQRYAFLGELSLRSNDPTAEEGLIGIVSAQRKFQHPYEGLPTDPESVGAAASQFGLHIVIHFSSVPTFKPSSLVPGTQVNHPGFRRVIRYLNEEQPQEGPLLDTCYTVGGPEEPMVWKDTPSDRTDALLERLANVPRPADPQLITHILLSDSLDLSIWAKPGEQPTLTASTPAHVIQSMDALHQNGLSMLAR